jgi:HAMP domain-containing protein
MVSLGLALPILATGSLSLAEAVPSSDQLLEQIALLQKAPAQADLLKQPLESAQSALKRARDARAAGDVEHGIELEGLAQDYVTLAREILHATEIEASLKKVHLELTRIETARHHTETLLEATIAQRERAKAKLSQYHAERDAKKANPVVTPQPKKPSQEVKRATPNNKIETKPSDQGAKK